MPQQKPAGRPTARRRHVQRHTTHRCREINERAFRDAIHGMSYKTRLRSMAPQSALARNSGTLRMARQRMYRRELKRHIVVPKAPKRRYKRQTMRSRPIPETRAVPRCCRTARVAGVTVCSAPKRIHTVARGQRHRELRLPATTLSPGTNAPSGRNRESIRSKRLPSTKE